MINEYLFLSDDSRSTVETYKPEGITVEISAIDNTSLWVAAYSLESRNEDSAKKLSEVHTALMQYSPLVLSCESSEYYNRVLFPLVNELERKLRKLLYLAASISDNEKAKENIKQLEEKDFGKIFDLLFIDPNFILDIKKRINAEAKGEFNGKGNYSKAEIESYLGSLVEHTLWDTILGEKDVPTLRVRFRDVQIYRNDVMHAHNIGKELFGKARYLFDKINKELDSAIGNLIGASEDTFAEQKPEVNTAISSAMAAMDLSTISEVLKSVSLSPAVLEMSSQMSQVLRDIQPQGMSAALTETMKSLQILPVQPAIVESLKEMTSSLSSPAISEAINSMNILTTNSAFMDTLKSLQPLRENTALAEAMRNATALQSTPAMESISRQMSQLTDLMRPYRQMVDILKPYSALQDSLRSIANLVPRNLSTVIESDNEYTEETEKVFPDTEKQEEDNRNEQP